MLSLLSGRCVWGGRCGSEESRWTKGFAEAWPEAQGGKQDRRRGRRPLASVRPAQDVRSGSVADFKALSRAYKGRPADELVADARAGRLATIRHRQGVVRGKSSFGVLCTHLKQQRSQAVRLARWQRLQGLALEQQAQVVAQEHISADAPFQVKRGLQALRSHQRLGAKAKHAADSQVSEKLAGWTDRIGKHRVESLKKHLPALADHDIVALPSGRFQQFVWQSDLTGLPKGAAAAASYKEGLGRRLETSWHEHHQTVMHAASQPIGQSAEGWRNKCCQAGECICSGDGYQRHRMSNRLANILKDACKRGSAMRQALLESCLVMRLAAPESESAEDDSDLELDLEGLGEVWLQVAFVSLSPWSLGLHRMRRVGGPAECDDGRDRIYLEALLVLPPNPCGLAWRHGWLCFWGRPEAFGHRPGAC